MSPKRRINRSEHNGQLRTRAQHRDEAVRSRLRSRTGAIPPLPLLTPLSSTPPFFVFFPVRRLAALLSPSALLMIAETTPKISRERARVQSRTRARAIRIFSTSADEWRLTGRTPECSCPVAEREIETVEREKVEKGERAR